MRCSTPISSFRVIYASFTPTQKSASETVAAQAPLVFVPVSQGAEGDGSLCPFVRLYVRWSVGRLLARRVGSRNISSEEFFLEGSDSVFLLESWLLGLPVLLKYPLAAC